MSFHKEIKLQIKKIKDEDILVSTNKLVSNIGIKRALSAKGKSKIIISEPLSGTSFAPDPQSRKERRTSTESLKKNSFMGEMLKESLKLSENQPSTHRHKLDSNSLERNR